ncbi:hypothetical protein CL617_04875 [archaeon]|nr:hypothetical protein [archaeon]|tara:strand:- start:3794 stop:4429 length:636 start_codon:yes stop_codon:yes gene_type:complete
MIGLWFVGILFFALIMGLIMYLVHIKRTEHEPMDYTLVDNFMSQYTKGHSQGILLEVIKGKKRDGIVFMPKDVDYMRKIKNKEKLEIKPQTIYVSKNKIILLPRGTWSSERNRMIVLPPYPENFPRDFTQTPFGKHLAKLTEDLNAEDTVIEVQRKRIDVENELLHKTEGGDRMKEHLITDKELTKDFYKKFTDAKEDKKGTSYTPPHTGG